MLFNDERSRNVYENKQKDDNIAGKKGDISTHFSQNHTFFSETAGFFVTMGAFENEFRTPKCRNSSPRVSPVANDIRPLRGRGAASTLTGPWHFQGGC
jgi:hypothetical protein